VQRRLEAAGFTKISQKGSHVKFARASDAGTDIATVPHKTEIPVGTLRSILSQAHLSLDQWEDF
jgi:predicted RNA binding protein YcfA (HicA-like mRNA interferase family)